MRSTPYDLRDSDFSSQAFYQRTREFSGKVLSEGQDRLKDELVGFNTWAEGTKTRVFSPGESLLELLCLGMVWERYLGASQSTIPWVVPVLKVLLDMRKWSETWKKLVDPWRGHLAGKYLLPLIGQAPRDLSPSLRNFKRLLKWLEASGEYEQEVQRLAQWLAYFLQSEMDFGHSLLRIMETYHWFKQEAQQSLGQYTQKVSTFQFETRQDYLGREDELFCQKSEVEYHLNMFAAVVMNQVLEPGFNKTKKRVVLLPGCMRRDEGRCQMTEEGDALRCTGCRPDCAVNKIRKEGLKAGFETQIILHSTKFSRSLGKWQNQEEVGVVASGCVLNLISRGYQFRRGNIPSQCLPLDYCGCQKHWDKIGRSTDLSMERLMEILGK